MTAGGVAVGAVSGNNRHATLLLTFVVEYSHVTEEVIPQVSTRPTTPPTCNMSCSVVI